MYSRPKSGVVPSDAQAKEKLALYVYEYLLHVGAQKAAQTFLSEIRWDKSISLGESPGFLHSWWCVFWDLYCAAPERRDTSEHSTEAKVFHEYGFVQNTTGAGPGAPPFAPPNGYMHNAPPGGLPPPALGGPQDGPPPGFPFHPGMGPGQPMPGGLGNCMDARGPPGGPQGPGAGPNQGPPPGMMQHGGPGGPPLGPGGMGHQRLTQTPPTQMGPGRMLVNAGPPNGPPGGPAFGNAYGGVNCSPLPPGPSNMSPLPTGGPPGRPGGPGGQPYSSASPVTFAGGGPGTPGQGGPMGPGSQDGDYMAMRHGMPPGMQPGQGGQQQGGPGSMAYMGGPGGPDGGMMMASEMGHILNGMDPQLEMKQSPRHPMMGGGPGSRGDDGSGLYPGMYSELQSMQSMQALAGMQPPNAANGGQQQATVHHLN